jgi:hypothetical protein
MLSSEIEQKRAPESSNLTQGGPLFLPGIQILSCCLPAKDLVCTTEDIFAGLFDNCRQLACWRKRSTRIFSTGIYLPRFTLRQSRS